MVLEILIAGLVGDAIHQEIKKAKQFLETAFTP